MQNGRHFPDDTFKYIFMNENVWISIKFSLLNRYEFWTDIIFWNTLIVSFWTIHDLYAPDIVFVQVFGIIFIKSCDWSESNNNNGISASSWNVAAS